MIVEDEILIRIDIAEHLRDCGFVVLEASSAEEARSLFATDGPIDVVFSDINMPHQPDGITLAAWIDQHYPNTSVVLTSGVWTNHDTALASCASVKAFVKKPYIHAHITGLLRSLADTSRA